jgi:tetratricopeptide (TPR) repeat protein
MHEQAESYLRQAISNKPKEFWSYVYLSTCLNKQKKHSQALEIAFFSKTFLNSKDKPYYYRLLGVTYYLLGSYELAIQSYGNSFQIQQEEDKYYYNAKFYLGNSHVKNGNFEKAKEILESLFYKLDEGFREIFYRALAETYEGLKDYSYASSYYNELVELYPKSEYYNWKAGQICQLNDSMDLAIGYFEKGIALAPESICHWHQKAYCLLSIEDIQVTISFVEEALKVWPKDRYLIELQSAAYIQAKEPEMSLKWIMQGENLGFYGPCLLCSKICVYFLKQANEMALDLLKQLVKQPDWGSKCFIASLDCLTEQLKLHGIPDFESLAQL